MIGATMADKRVIFDFAVQFSNGGGIQGQGFRLDIEGDTISDDALAAHIIGSTSSHGWESRYSE
jgi:hypothetical protein